MVATETPSTAKAEPTVVTATELARNLSDILNRVKYKGERFEVQRSGETVAILGPLPPRKTATMGDFIDLFRNGPRPDDQFADDLEAVLAELPKIDWSEYPEWPD